MDNQNIKKNYIFNLSYQILITIIPIITTPYLSRILHAEGIGANSYAFSMVTYFTLIAGLGTGTYAQRKIARFQNDKVARSRIFTEVFKLRLITSIFAIILYSIYCIYLVKSYACIALLYGLLIINTIFDITWLFQGMENFRAIVFRNTVVRILNVAIIFLFVKTENDLIIYVASYVITTLLGSISMWSYAKRYVSFSRKVNPFENMREILELFIPTIAVQIYTILDRTMIGWFTNNSTENGYYCQTENMIKLCLMIITSLGTVMLPRISKLYAENKKNEIKVYLNKSFRYVWMLSLPLTVGMIAIAKTFVPVFFGSGYDKSIILMYILSVIIVFISLSNVTGNQYLLPTNKQKEYSISLIVGSIVNVMINLCLIPRLYSIGAAIATVCAEFSVVFLQLIFVKKEGFLNVKKLLSLSKIYLFASTIMGISVVIISNFCATSVLGLVIEIVFGMIIYFTILFVFKDEMFISLIKMGIGIVKKK